MAERKRSRSPRRRRASGNTVVSNSTKRKPVDKRIFISNLPWEAKWQDIKDLFRKEIGEVSFVQLFNDETGRPRGAGVLEFPTADLAKKAIDTMHRLEYKGRKIVVKEDFDVERDKFGRIITDKDRERMAGSRRDRSASPRRGGGHSSGGGGGGFVNFGNTYGLSPRFLESLGIDCELHTRVFVANLDYAVDEKKLKEVFRLAGKVVGVELSRDKEGKSRGFAVVVFDHPVEAVQAISMFNEQQLLDRRITVRFDKVAEEEQPRSLKRLPDGLRGVGMGLGQDGVPLWDVRATLGENMNQGNTLGLGSLATSMAQQQQPPAAAAMAAANTTAAIQAALTTILGMAGAQQQQQQQVGLLGQAGLMGVGGGGMGLMGNGGGMGSGGMGASGMSMERQMDMERSMMLERNMDRGGMGRSGDMGDRDIIIRGNSMERSSIMGGMDRGMGGLLDRGMSGDSMGDRGMRGIGDRSMGGMMDDLGMGGMTDRGMMGGMGDRGMMGGMGDRGLGGMGDRGMGGMGDRGMGDRGMGGMMDRGVDMGMSSRSSGLDSGMMKRSGTGISDKIIVKNLPLDCTWQNLKDRFAHAGDIKFAEIKERGVGIIRFGTERDAERAVSMMNGQRMDTKNIIVSLY